MFTISQLAAKIDGEVVGDGSIVIKGIAATENAQDGDVTFAEKEAFLAAAESSPASAVVVPQGFSSITKALIRVKNPRLAMTVLLPLFYPPRPQPWGIHPSAVVDPSAQVDISSFIGPNCVVGAGSRLGKRSMLMGGNYMGDDCLLGDDVVLHPNVVVYSNARVGDRVIIHASSVIGSDGYGYVFSDGHHHKMLQIGDVRIGNDVEIGSNVSIDRGALGSTTIGDGSKIDNLVHIAHNVTIGRHCLVMGQVGFAGSTVLGNYVVVASQSGIAGHLKIGHQSTIGAKSGVMRDIPDGETVLGYPAAPDKQAKRQWIAVAKLPEVIARVRALETRQDRPDVRT